MAYNNRQYTLIPIGKAVYCLFVLRLTPNEVSTCVERRTLSHRTMHVLTSNDARRIIHRLISENYILY